MKTMVKRILSIVVCLSMLCGMIVVGDASDDRTYADPATGETVNPYNKAYIGEYPATDTSLKSDSGDDLGTAGNPFVVLEIVPQLDQAQFGYFVPGCEPIDMAFLAEDINNVDGVLSPVGKNFTITKKWNPNSCTIKNNDTFVKKIFGSSSYGSDGFVSNVVTITPADLGSNLNLVKDADLIYFHDSTNQEPLRNIWYKYNKDVAKRGENPEAGKRFDAENDITNQTAIEIMRRLAEDDPPAVIFDGTKAGFSNDEDIYNNIPKLEMMSTMFKVSDFVSNEELKLLDTIEEKSQGTDKLYYPVKQRDSNGDLVPDTSGNYIDDPFKSQHWSVAKNIDQPKTQGGTFAFDPTGEKELISYMRYSGGSFTSNNVFDKIFIYDGSGLLMSQLLESVTVSFNITSEDPLHGGAYNIDMVEYYKNLDSEKSSYTPLDVIKYILNISQYKPFLSVLEVQPCQQFIYNNTEFKMKDANGNLQKTIDGKPAWQKYYEGLFPWYDSEQEGGKSWVTDKTRLKVTTMTTAEFIGSTGRYEYGQVDEYGTPLQLTYESSDDLTAKYDMIVFGSMQDASNGKDGYNDPLLGHLLYTAVGDLVYKFDDPNYKTKVSTDDAKLRDRVRYSGTDISLKKMLELRDFLRAGKPIVADEELYTSDGAVDTLKVDKSSKLYDLLTWKDKAATNIFRYGHYTGNKMKNIIAKSQCHLVFASDSEAYPLEYSYSSKDKVYTQGSITKTAKGVIDTENYQAKDADGKAIMKYHFYVSGVPGSKYQVHLNLDYDGDGVYRGSLKQRSEIDNMNTVMGYGEGDKETYNEAEVPLGMEIYNNNDEYIGNSSDPNCTLEEGELYYATFELPKSKLGIVPWKLEVNDVTNPYLRSSAVDYTAFSKNTGTSKVRINVLQMCLPHGGLTNWSNNGITSNFVSFASKSVDIGSKKVNGKKYYDSGYMYSEHDDNNFINKLYSLTGNHTAAEITAKKFETFIAPVDEFDVHIQFLYNSDWNTLFGDGAVNSKGQTLDKEGRLTAWKSFLTEYDMIVLGFEDENAFTSSEVFTKGFDDFISQGKGVILSHDTVEGANANKNYYGKYASWLRTVSGQRRAYYNQDGDGTYSKSYLTTYTNGTIIDDPRPDRVKEYNKYTGSELAKMVNKGKLNGYISPNLLSESESTITYSDKKWGHYFTPQFDLESVEKEFMYDPPKNATQAEKDLLKSKAFVKENLDNAAQLYAVYGSDYNERRDLSDKNKARDKADRVITTNKYSSSWPDQNAGTSVVKLTNNGQITTYPYLINPLISVANTHCQNYQLDMEYQSGGDVNVWFNLTDFGDPELKDPSNKAVKDEASPLSNKWTRIYSSKNQDSRNNFYIYNKGNITYTGSGHGTSKQELTDDEVKLFINTMISAYRAPEEGPTVTIDNATSTSDSNNLIYVDYDTKSNTDEPDSDILDSNIITASDGKRYAKVEFTLDDNSLEESSNESTGGNTSAGETSERTYYLSIKDSSGNVIEPSKIIFPTGVTEPTGVNSSGYMQLPKNAAYNPDYPENKKKYTMLVPYDEVANGGKVDFTFTTYCEYKKRYRLKDRIMRTPKSITNASVMILPLFDLN